MHLLELQLPGELVLCLLQLLALLDVLFLEVMNLSLHRLKLGEELEARAEAGEEGLPEDQGSPLHLSPKAPWLGLDSLLPF